MLQWVDRMAGFLESFKAFSSQLTVGTDDGRPHAS
jgi:hypothetical protein